LNKGANSMLYRIVPFALFISAALLTAQQPQPFSVKTGTRIPLSMLNSVSSKSAAPGDRIYLETVFPIVINSRIVIPAGSYVAGTVTDVKRSGRIKGRAELYVQFDALTLPNGVTRDFRARIGALDGRASEELDKDEGKLKAAGGKGKDAQTIAEAAGAGASVGGIAGGLSGHPGAGLGMGAAGGAAAGLIGVLLSRGPDAMLAKGTTVDMVLDRELSFQESELNFSAAPPPPRATSDDSLPSESKKNEPRRRLSPLPF
jgi:type IV secretion system protein VirB10